jgi:hypothetical protein
MSPSVARSVLLALTLCASGASAQKNLGELLDAGARKMSAEEFRHELVGKVVVGPGPSGNVLELVYLDDGQIQGIGANTMMGGEFAPNVQYGIRGSWRVEDTAQICASMWIGRVTLPARCQYWYSFDGRYYQSDSDFDRSTSVLPRTIKR